MEIAHLFEAVMLICFGFSWPLNVIKAYRARTAKGTSLPFIILIITGYIAGITAKFINGQYNYVLAVYFLNLAIVMTNIFVYIRNKALDRKSGETESVKIKNISIEDVVEAKEENMTNYTNSLDEIINRKSSSIEMKNSVILFGGSMDKKIPVAELAKSFDFNFDIYNKSEDKLTVADSGKFFQNKVAALQPEGILIHLGDSDYTAFKNDPASFDKNYIDLIDGVKAVNKKCRIALVSVNNPSFDKTIALMNAHIKAIAESENASFINLENAKLWNPEATKAASEFAYNMGLKTRKPLRDVAEILYSYAYHNFDTKPVDIMAG
ncbi:MAG: SGNH/GDSL hydrolase family protein [Treponema sp.]|nr:SGNH/GDSL hydrolase family protein [Treponema sp.]